MKYIPNILTGFRIAGSILLMFIKPLSIPFYVFYTLCGVTDILDGYIARKTRNTSTLGAKLDSIADLIFIVVMLFVLFPLFSFHKLVLFWTIGIAVIRIVSLIVGYAKYKSLTFLHTYANKATGLILFLFPYIYLIFGANRTEYIILLVATLSALEEITITITSKTLDLNVKSIITVTK
jgi:Phosphatidylglycerophosphate synthase